MKTKIQINNDGKLAKACGIISVKEFRQNGFSFF